MSSSHRLLSCLSGTLLTLLLLSSEVRGTGDDDALSQLTPYVGRRYCRKETDDSYTPFLKAIGVHKTKRAILKMANPCVTLRIEDGKYEVQIKGKGIDHKQVIELGTPFDIKTLDGRDSRSTFTMDGSVLKNEQVCEDKTVNFMFQFSEEELRMTGTVDDITTVVVHEYRPEDD